MRRTNKKRPSAKRAVVKRHARSSGTSSRSGKNRQGPSRLAKARVLERIRRETREVNGGSMLATLRRQGYEELPLEEIQDRLSKLRTALAEFIISRRG